MCVAHGVAITVATVAIVMAHDISVNICLEVAVVYQILGFIAGLKMKI